jgi:zinc protease
MVKLLERKGLRSLADTNASTGSSRRSTSSTCRATIPSCSTPLMPMRETVSELKFPADEAVNRERGVVMSDARQLNQRRNLKTISWRSSIRWRSIPTLADCVPETLDAATGASLRAFWERYPADTRASSWSAISDPAVVGNVAKFADHCGKAPTAPAGDPKQKAQTDILVDPALSERVTVARHGPWRDVN